MTSVELGFVEEETHACYLESHYFPSKVGGKPAWLALQGLPSSEQLACGVCGNPCVFLLQVKLRHVINVTKCGKLMGVCGRDKLMPIYTTI